MPGSSGLDAGSWCSCGMNQPNEEPGCQSAGDHEQNSPCLEKRSSDVRSPAFTHVEIFLF